MKARPRVERMLECNVWARLCLLVFAILVGCASTAGPTASPGAAPAGADPNRHEYTRLCMGVRTRIVIYSPDEDAATEAAARAFERIGELDGMMSDYRRDSDLTHLSDRAGGPTVQVPHDLYDILAKAERVSMASGGEFDVTVGPLVALWRQARRTGVLPDPEGVSKARRLVGWEMVKLEGVDRVRLVKAGMRLDLGGIAKGYAAQRAVQVLKDHGFKQVMVALAGDIVVGDAPPGKDGWRVVVVGELTKDQDPGAPVPGRPVLILKNEAVSTSGDAEQFVEVDGKRYSHIVDPATGLGMTALRSATVVAPTGEEADALSTAACLLGVEKGRAMLRKWGGVGAIFEEGGTRETVKAGREVRLVER